MFLVLDLEVLPIKNGVNLFCRGQNGFQSGYCAGVSFCLDCSQELPLAVQRYVSICSETKFVLKNVRYKPGTERQLQISRPSILSVHMEGLMELN